MEPDKIMQPQNTLDFRLNKEIHERDLELLAATLNDAWGWLVQINTKIMQQRLESGAQIIAAYDSKKDDEEIRGVDLSNFDGEIPIVLLETVLLKTGGNYEKVPLLYRELTNNGLFMPPPPNPDTVMFVDLTAIPSRRGLNGNGEIKKTLEFALDYFSGRAYQKPPFNLAKIEYPWTFTPDIRGLVLMHVNCGARDSNHVINGARNPFLNGLRGLEEREFWISYPEHNTQLHHTRVMDYSAHPLWRTVTTEKH